MRLVDKIDKLFMTLSICWLFLIMIIVAIDGFLRQFFDAPINGAYVLVENYLMVAMIFPAIGYTWAKKGHISITFVHDKLPRAIQNLTYLLTILMGLFIMGLIGYTGYEKTLTAFTANHLTSGLVRWPLWIAYVWVPVGSGIFILRLIIEFIIGLTKIIKHGFNNILISEVKDSV